MHMSQTGSDDSKDLMNKLALMNYLKWTIFLMIFGVFICKYTMKLRLKILSHSVMFANVKVYQIWSRMNRKKSSALGRTGPRPPTRAEALLKMLKANNYPAHQLSSLEHTVVN